MVHSVDGLILRHFGLRENPFGVTPDPRFLFMSHTHREALASLANGIECGFGFQVLVAQPGMGKTTLLFDFLERFQTSRTAFLFQQQHDSREFLQSLLIELKSDSEETSGAKLYSRLNHLLSESAHTRERVIVVVDEAQNLDDSVLETLRQLSNFETARSKLLQIVLAGQPQLAKNLGRPEQQQLRQRVSTIARLSPFGIDETKTYLTHRLNVAEYRGPEIFTMPAVQSIWSNSHGIPRNINTLCFNAMLLAFAEGKRRVDESAVKEAAQDLDLEYVLADVAGSGRSSVGFGDQTSKDGAVPDQQKSNGHQPSPTPPAPRLSPGNGHRSLVRVPAAPAVPAANAVPAAKSPVPASVGLKTRTLPNAPKAPQKAPLVLASSDSDPLASIADLGPSLPTSSWKKFFWGSLVAAAVGAGVIFGHGLGIRNERQLEERLEALSGLSLSSPAQDPQPAPEVPVIQARKEREKEPRPRDDNDPDVIVRTFPQSVPSSDESNLQPNVKAVFFDPDSDAVAARYNPVLQKIAELLSASPQSTAIIEGHTDNSGEEPYNLDLSTRRAQALKDLLVNRYGVDAARLSTVGAGSSTPLESNATTSGRAYNRRAEVRIVMPETNLAAAPTL